MTPLLDQLVGAVGRGEMELHFQPEIDLTTGSVTAMEALLRWAHPGRGMLWPGDFLADAETGGLTPALGAWVLSRALQEARHFAAGTRIWVNASTAELADPRYPVRVQQALSGLAVSNGVIGVDLPEQALLSLGHSAASVCAQLRAAGAALSVEYSGEHPDVLDLLPELGIEVLKISRGYVRGIEAPERAADAEMLVRATASVGATVTASGVESWSEAQRLQQLGVTRAHGFLLSPPMRADRIRWALGRGDMGRGSYLQDGSGWLTSSRYAAALHDVLPHGAPELLSDPADRRVGVTPAAPAPAAAPLVAPPVAPPLPHQGAGRVDGAEAADPFGRGVGGLRRTQPPSAAAGPAGDRLSLGRR